MRKNTLLMLDVAIDRGNYPIHDFFLHIMSGELVGLIGTEGSGKHAIFEILTEDTPLKRGKIKFCDTVDTFYAKDYFEKAGGIFVISRMPEIVREYTVAETLFILEDVNYLSRMVSKKTMELEAEKIFNKFGIMISPKARMSDLSDIEIKVVQIIRAYIKHARLLILNDIMENAIQKDVMVLLKLLKSIAKQGMSVLWINSYPDAFNAVADKTVVIKNGCTACVMYSDQYDEQRLLNVMSDDTESYTRKVFEHPLKGKKILQITNVCTKQLPPFQLECMEGEILGIYDLANNFSSELLNILLGVQKYSGIIYMNGKAIKIKKKSDLVKNKIGIINGKTYRNQIFGKMTIVENISIAAEKKSSILKMFLNFRIKSYAEKTRKRFIKEYSRSITGEELDRDDAIKIFFLRYMIAGVKVLFCFQPFLGLDVNEQEQLMTMIRSMTNKKIAVIIISAEKNSLNKICNRIIVIRHRKILETDED